MTGIKKSQNLISVDFLRAVAALGVFYLHNHSGGTIAKYTHLNFFAYTDIFGAYYAVPLFFLISGYCIHLSNIKYVIANKRLPIKKYYLQRFLRIFPPYLAALALSLMVNLSVEKNYTVNIYDLLIHLFCLQGFSVPYFNSINIVLWTISVEMAFYVIYPVFYYLRYKYSLNYALAFAFIISVISIWYFTVKGNVTLPERFCVFNLWFPWCCGAYLADKTHLNPADLKKPIFTFIYLLILAGFMCLNFIPNKLFILFDQFNVLFWTAPLLFVLSKEYWLRKKRNLWGSRIIAGIGLSSYSLYLMHGPLIGIKNYLVHQYFPARFQWVGVLLGIFIIPLITWFSYCYIERPFTSQKNY